MHSVRELLLAVDTDLQSAAYNSEHLKLLCILQVYPYYYIYKYILLLTLMGNNNLALMRLAHQKQIPNLAAAANLKFLILNNLSGHKRGFLFSQQSFGELL